MVSLILQGYSAEYLRYWSFSFFLPQIFMKIFLFCFAPKEQLFIIIEVNLNFIQMGFLWSFWSFFKKNHIGNAFE